MTHRITRKLTILATILVIAISGMYVVNANNNIVPLGSEIQRGASETANASQYPASSTQAEAGNITQLTLSGWSQTKHWQGYYGEITGTIVLDDAQNWTLYDWPNPEPKGEIYATINATSPVWSSVACLNYTGGADGAGLGNVTSWENFFNMTWNDVDGINETFNMTQHPLLSVGSYTINQSTCPSTYTHVSDDFQTDKYVELLLTDNTGQLIFTTIIENDDEANNTDPIGYDGSTHDFQMLVAEDGTSLDTGGQINEDSTTYYFYIDLE